MPNSDHSATGFASKTWSAVRELLEAASVNPAADPTSGFRTEDDLPTWFSEQREMESGRSANERLSGAPSSPSTAVPFSAASTARPSTSGWGWRKAVPHNKPVGQDLEAGPESVCEEEEETKFGEKERETPEELV